MSIFLTIVGVLAVAWLPGAALFRVPFGARDRRAALDAEERAFWTVVLSVAWSLGVVVILAGLWRFTLARLISVDLGLVALLVVVFRRRLRLSAGRRHATRTAWLPLGIVALAAWLFFPAFPHVLGGKDPGVYVNEGIQIAQRGTLLLRDSVVASVPVEARDLFYPWHGNTEYYGIRFMGFFILDPASGTVVGQFPHVFPASIAIGYALGGLEMALAVTPVLAILGLLSVYFAGVRLIGRWPALAGTAMLALNAASIWFGREPSAEGLSQMLVFGGVLAFSRAHVDGDRFFAPVSAWLFGLLIFARIIDGPLALVAIAAVLLAQVLDGKRPSLLFLSLTAVFVVLAAAYADSALMRPYLLVPRFAIAENWRLVQAREVALAAGGALALAVLLVVAMRTSLGGRLRWLMPRLLAVAVVIAAVYAYFFRVPVHNKLAWGDARSLEVFSWYVPPLALGCAVAGYAILTWKRFWRDPAFFMIAAVYSFFFFYKMRIVPEHFWAARRFVPVILPATCLGFAAMLSFLATIPRPKALSWLGRGAAVLLACVGFGQLVSPAAALLGHTEHAGVTARLHGLAERFTDQDLVIVESRNTGSDIHVFALPLAYIYNRNVLVLADPKPDKARFRHFLDWASSRYRNVYFVGGGGTDLVSSVIGVEPVASDRFQLPEYQSGKNAYPREVRWKEFDFGVYRLTRASTITSSFRLDIGIFDDLNVVRFHAKEKQDGEAFRWSQRSSYVALPTVDGARTLTVWMSDGGRPKSVEPANVSVYLNDRLLGTASPALAFAPFTFAIPDGTMVPSADPDRSSLVRLVSNTWKPSQAKGTGDSRDLGVMVRRIEVK